MQNLKTVERRLLADTDADIPGFFAPLYDLWLAHKSAAAIEFPDYSHFDVLDVPRSHVSHLILCKLIGTPRRFFYEVVGQAIESHNGFPASKRFLADLPLKNKHVMAREFGITVIKRAATYSRGPYIGHYDYVKQIERLICPYRIEGETFAFVTMARFTIDDAEMQRARAGSVSAIGLDMHKSAAPGA